MKTLLFAILLMLHQATFGQGCAENSNSIEFDGINDYIELQPVDLPGSFTVECWIKPNQLTTQHIISKHDHSLDANYLLSIQNNEVTSYSYVGGVGYDLFGGTVQTGIWSHVAYVYDSNTNDLALYVNGVKKDSATTSGGSPFQNNWNTRIGNGAVASPYYFDGLIDEVRLWKRALSSSEINAKMNKQLIASFEQNLEGYWQFNEGSGLQAYDSSGNGNTGVLVFPTWSTNVPFLGGMPITAGAIQGNNQVNEFDFETYNVTQIPNHTYNWNINGGNITSGNGTNSIIVQWSTKGIGTLTLIEACGSYSDTSSFTITISTGINELNFKYVHSIYPNPFSLQTTMVIDPRLTNESSLTLSLYNTLGQEVRSIEGIRTSQVIIQRGNLSNGLYFFKLIGEKGLLGTGKIIVD